MRARIQKISKYTPSIFQGRIDFSAKGRGFSLTVAHPIERAAFWILFGTLGVLVVLYLYFASVSILNAIARNDAMKKNANISGHVSQLEREYLTDAQGLGPEDGARVGLSPVANIVYVHRPGNTAALPLLRDEI